MIKFFRKIRYNLMSGNKTAKYFKYAIGEVLLVMIGILLALQVNNWNQTRKDRVLEKTYLIGLKEDIESTLAFISRSKEEIDLNQIASSNIEKIFNSSEPFDQIALTSLRDSSLVVNDTINLLLCFERLGYLTAYPKNSYTLDEMKSAGQSNVLTNEMLKRHISNYYNRMDRYETWFERKMSRMNAHDDVRYLFSKPKLANLVNLDDTQRINRIRRYGFNPNERFKRIRAYEGFEKVLFDIQTVQDRLMIENEWREEHANELLIALKAEIDKK